AVEQADQTGEHRILSDRGRDSLVRSRGTEAFESELPARESLRDGAIESLVRAGPVDESDLLGRDGVHELAGVDHPLGERLSDAPAGALRTAESGIDADAGFGEREHGAVGGDDGVARERHLEAASERHSVETGDHRLGTALDLLV